MFARENSFLEVRQLIQYEFMLIKPEKMTCFKAAKIYHWTFAIIKKKRQLFGDLIKIL